MDFSILLISDTLCDANGVSRFIQDMSSTALSEGRRFFALSSTSKHICPKQDNLIIIKPTVKVKMPFYPELDLVAPPFGKLTKIVKEINPKIIHLSTPGPIGLYGLKVARELGIKTTGTYHTDFPGYMFDNTKSRFVKGVTSRYMRYFYSRLDGIFVRSNVYRQKLVADIGIDNEKIFELKPGINTKRFNTSYRDGEFWGGFHKVKKDSIKALYVGRLTAEKNFGFLIETWKHFCANYRGELDIELICVGEGKAQKDKHGLDRYGITFLGYKGGDELSKVYANSDIFLFPSVTDTLGQVVMEAQNSGLTVMVSDIGGPKGVINLDGDSGYSLPIDKELWAQKIAFLAQNRELCKKMGENGARAISRMDIKDSFHDFWEKNRSVV